jgi:hypothetical protein
MMLALPVYCYIKGVFGSRRIEEATYTDVAVRYICGGKAHPDFSVICAFRRENREAFEEAFVKVLGIAQELGHLKRKGDISVDGTKVKANASKHKAVSYEYAKKQIAELEGEVKELVEKAETADCVPLQEGLKIAEEIELREERKGKLEEAKREIEARYEEVKKGEQEAYERKMKERAEQEERTGKKAGGKAPSPPAAEPPGKSRYNFTDSESRIMKGGTGKHFEQAYNAQAAVDEGSMLIAGTYVTNHGNDKQELANAVKSIDGKVYEAETVSADSGYYSEGAVKEVEQEDEEGKKAGPEVYCAVGRQSHHRTVADLEQQKEEPVGEGATAKEQMAAKVKSAEGKEIYKKRKETVEPVFGIIKQAMGFRQFLLRGLERVGIEWKLVSLAYNMKRLCSLSGGRGLSVSG